ncbi:acyl carrier protein [Streptomyces sp. SID8352]|uniref:acyl carrier protein n=1 Tax=Streptomyces sp. SID8352 TaxID=2690338 RepID=UPI00136B5327|nr:acyl carrier protein [Streptomyces sp. SID8352]MYU21138.1 hypothetical protein [Streptomyces sp. SID8352]
MTIETQLHSFIRGQLGWNGDPVELTDETQLIQGGILDSLRLLELVAFLQREYAFEVKDIDLVLDNFATITALAGYVRRSTSDPSDTQVT